MNTEIERKFLLSRDWRDSAFATACYLIRQGYLTRLGITIRVRQSTCLTGPGESFTLTVKGKSELKGLKRSEVEIPITGKQFEALWPLTKGARIAKHRYIVGQVEVDVFTRRKRLIMAEVEFKTVRSAKQFKPPGWFGREVTDDPAFTNSALSA